MCIHEKTLQPRYSTHRGFSFLFYCQQCFDGKDEWLNVDEIQRRLNLHANLLEALEGAEKNTVLLIEHLMPVYEKYGYGITQISSAIAKAKE